MTSMRNTITEIKQMRWKQGDSMLLQWLRKYLDGKKIKFYKIVKMSNRESIKSKGNITWIGRIVL